MPCEGKETQDTEGRYPCENHTNQGHLEIPERHEKRSLEASEGTWPCQHLNSGLLASRPIGEQMSVAESV